MRAGDHFDLQGRAEALVTLRDHLARARSGRGALIVVSGEPGIGKSAVGEVIAREAAEAGAAVERGRAWEFSEAPPYFPLASCLRSLGVELGTTHRSPSPFEVWDLVLSALAAATTQRPAVWIIEDLHAADLQTLDLLAFLARPIGALRVLIVVTARSHDPRLDQQGQQRIVRLGRDGLELPLEPLRRDDVAALAQQVIGTPISPAVASRLTELTGGNPLFVTECARAIVAAGHGADRVDLPATVRHAILERAARLPAACQETLRTAAVVGRDFTAALVARIVDASPARVSDDLEPAVRAGLVDETAPGCFSFRHVIVRDVLEAAIGAQARVALHARAERALASQGDSPELLVERARHALAGATLENADRALALATQAATWLEARGAFDRAYAMHVRIEGARRAGLLPAASAADRLELVRIARNAGRHADALKLCDEIAVLARATEDAGLLGRVAWERGADLRPGVVEASLVGLLEEALAVLPPEPSGLRCRLLARLAAAKQPSTDGVVPLAMARDAIAQARVLAAEDVMRDVLFFAGAALVDVAGPEERLDASEELLRLSLRAGDVVHSLRAHARLAVDRVEVGEFDAFDEGVDRMLEISSAAGQARHRWRPLLFASMRAQMSGRFGESERYLLEASQLTGLTDDPALGLSLAAHRMRRARSMHRRDEALEALHEYEKSMQGVPQGDLVLTAFRLGCWARFGDAAAVAAELERLGTLDAALWQRGFHGFLAEAYALAGNDDQRRRARAFFAPTAERHLVVSHVAMAYEGPTLRLLGLLDASLGDLAAAERSLRRAAEGAETRGHRPWVAQLRHELASVVLRAGRRLEARALFAEAAALARDLGMDGLAQRSPLSPVTSGSSDRDARPGVSTAPRLELIARGDTWRVDCDGEIFDVRDSRGMQLLARLIERPREEFHVLVLASDSGHSVAESNAGEMLDERARREYTRRLTELADDIAEAERNVDSGRVTRLTAEKEMLEQELLRAFGLGGRSRQARSASERARVNVQRRIKDALARITEISPRVGQYLDGAVRTGTYCCFRP